MTQEEKDLLLKYLCATLPYGVKYCREYLDYERDQEMCAVGTLESIDKDGYINDTKVYTVWDIKPYLRPMSSMTEEERLELSRLTDDKFKFYLYTTKPEIICYEKYNYLEGLKVLDWLNAHHFDFRNLIGKGLALETPDDMYNI